MEVGLVRRIDIDAEMQQSYLDYAMSVIVARALPDARDGLKPVHRRILHAMYSMGVRPAGDFKKSARIVGEVLGKYHPHGDMAVYDAMARMAQDFSMRYALVEGQGNFGSIDGDSPAAMRYTEARLAPLAMLALDDIDLDTVDFVPNFDGTLPEPTVLPAGFPNLLVNGATGIAVGMATNIPPHNLGEICDALVFLLDNWTRLDKVTVEDLMNHVHGPDFPTGGLLLRSGDKSDGLASAYGTGRGRVVVQARAHIEAMGRGRSRLIVTELPYQTNKSSLIERIAELTRSGDLEGLTDLRDESDRQGMRIVIELARSADPEAVLTRLYQRTPMQSTFGISLLALVDEEPRLLSLKQALRVYLDHRLEVTRRRSQYELERARERAHVLAGLRTALQHLDEVVQMIRTARDVDQARTRLRKRFQLSEIQANAILDMPLRRLASLERKKIDQEHKEMLARIDALEALLGSEKKMRSHVAEGLRRVKADYGDRRRTQIVATARARRRRGPLTSAEASENKDTWVVVTGSGLISRTPTARLPRLSGKDSPTLVAGARTRDTLYLFAGDGRCAAVEVHRLPESEDPSRGASAGGATPLPPGVRPVAAITLPAESDAPSPGFLIFATGKGVIKKVEASALPGPSARTFTAIRLASGDTLGWVRPSSGRDDVLLAGASGSVIRFGEGDLRPVGPGAAGVAGMRLEPRERLVGLEILHPGDEVLALSDGGLGKRVPAAQFPVQRRAGRGVRVFRTGTGLAGIAVGGEDSVAFAILARAAAKVLRFSAVPRRTRAANGAKLVEVRSKDRLVWIGAPIARVAAEARGGDARKARAKSSRGKGGRGRGAPARSASARKGSAPRKKAGTAGKKPATQSRAKKKSSGRKSRDSVKPKKG